MRLKLKNSNDFYKEKNQFELLIKTYEQHKEQEKCLNDVSRIYMIEKYLKVFNYKTREYNNLTLFEPQKRLLEEISINQHNIIDKNRQCGVSTMIGAKLACDIVTSCITSPDITYNYIFYNFKLDLNKQLLNIIINFIKQLPSDIFNCNISKKGENYYINNNIRLFNITRFDTLRGIDYKNDYNSIIIDEYLTLPYHDEDIYLFMLYNNEYFIENKNNNILITTTNNTLNINNKILKLPHNKTYIRWWEIPHMNKDLTWWEFKNGKYILMEDDIDITPKELLELGYIPLSQAYIDYYYQYDSDYYNFMGSFGSFI